MADVQESYPLPTNGIGKPLFIKLTGIGVTNANPETPSGTLVGGNNTYKVTLSVANSISAGASATVAITASLYDLAGTFQSVTGSVSALSYNALPTASSGTNQSYPAPKATVGDVAHVGAVSFVGSAGVATITPDNPGQAVIEFEYPFGGEASPFINSSLIQRNDKVYSQVLVTVVP